MRKVLFIAGDNVLRLFMPIVQIDEEDGNDIGVFKEDRRLELQETPVTHATGSSSEPPQSWSRPQ